MAAADARFEPHAIWRRLAPQAGPGVLLPAAARALLGCQHCDQLVRADAARAGHGCTARAAAPPLHQRKPDSLARTWALVLTAAILYIPANLLPVMTVISFGQGEPDTIIERREAS